MRATPILFAGLAGALCVAGCGVTVGPSEVPSTFYYDVVVPGGDPGPKVAETVALRPFSQSDALDRDGIRYMTSDVESGYWTYHRWAMPVSALVRAALALDLERSGTFSEVLLLDNSQWAEYLVDAEVRQFASDETDGWSAVVEITFEVTRSGTGRLVLHRRIREKERCEAENVPAVVKAMGRALRRAFDEFERELVRATAGGGR
jgi:ABC-type uncharacterized transport system auxiliary subunit